MNCPRCQTELPDSATFCTTCGSVVRQNTQTLQNVQPSFSYLPPGTPPWPTTVPQGFSYASRPLTSANSTSAGSEEQHVTRTKLPTRTIAIIASVLILMPIIGAIFTLGSLYTSGKLFANTAPQPVVTVPSPTAIATPGTGTATPSTSQGNQLPTPTSFQKSTNAPNVGVNLKYPGNWVEEAAQSSTNGSYVRLHPQQQLGILFIIERFSASTSSTIPSANALNQSLIQGLGSTQGFNNVQPLQSTTPQRTIGGTMWDSQEASYTDDSGNKMHLATISVQHNKLYYSLILLIPDVYYNEAIQKYIQPMFDSLQFVS